MTPSKRASALRLAIATAMFLATTGVVLGEQALAGSEARRAALCAGDYVCDEDGSFAIAHIWPNERSLRLSLQAIDDAMRTAR